MWTQDLVARPQTRLSERCCRICRASNTVRLQAGHRSRTDALHDWCQVAKQCERGAAHLCMSVPWRMLLQHTAQIAPCGAGSTLCAALRHAVIVVRQLGHPFGKWMRPAVFLGMQSTWQATLQAKQFHSSRPVSGLRQIGQFPLERWARLRAGERERRMSERLLPDAILQGQKLSLIHI